MPWVGLLRGDGFGSGACFGGFSSGFGLGVGIGSLLPERASAGG